MAEQILKINSAHFQGYGSHVSMQKNYFKKYGFAERGLSTSCNFRGNMGKAPILQIACLKGAFGRKKIFKYYIFQIKIERICIDCISRISIISWKPHKLNHIPYLALENKKKYIFQIKTETGTPCVHSA